MFQSKINNKKILKYIKIFEKVNELWKFLIVYVYCIVNKVNVCDFRKICKSLNKFWKI